MNRIFGRVAVTVAATAMAVAIAVPAMAQASSSTASPVVYNCGHKAHSEPQSLLLYCADGNDQLVKMHWSDWGKATATTKATVEINLCNPNCAAGKFHHYKVDVSVTDLHTKGTARYGKLKMSFVGKKPKGAARVAHFKLTKRGPVAA